MFNLACIDFMSFSVFFPFTCIMMIQIIENKYMYVTFLLGGAVYTLSEN